MSIIWQLVLIGSLLQPCSADKEYEWHNFYNAIRLVECYPTGPRCDLDPSHLGNYQISYAHWKLSQTPGQWEMVQDNDYARLVMMNYWKRFNPDAVENMDFEILARMHNGGTRYNKATDKYWQRVQIVMSGKNWWNGQPIPEEILNTY